MCEELSDIWQQDMTNESEAWDKKNWNEHGQIDVWVCMKRKEEKCRIKRTVGIRTSQFGD